MPMKPIERPLSNQRLASEVRIKDPFKEQNKRPMRGLTVSRSMAHLPGRKPSIS